MEMIRINLEYDSPYAYYKIRFEFSDIPFIFHNILFFKILLNIFIIIFVFYAIISSNSVYVNKFIVYYSVCFYKNILIELHSSSLSLDEFHFHLFAQLFYDLDHIFP